jgi:hypothetical protein
VRSIYEDGTWRVVTRMNRNGNLAVEVELLGAPHAELILQAGGVVDLGTKARPWPLGNQGWGMPGAPMATLRKFRFGPDMPPEG